MHIRRRVGKNRVRAVAHAEMNRHAIFAHPTSCRRMFRRMRSPSGIRGGFSRRVGKGAPSRRAHADVRVTVGTLRFAHPTSSLRAVASFTLTLLFRDELPVNLHLLLIRPTLS